MANEILLAVLAIGAICLVVKSGDKEKQKVSDKRTSDEADGMSPEDAKRLNPTEEDTDNRRIWLGRLMEVEVEYADIIKWETKSQAQLQEDHTFPPKIWNRIRVVNDQLGQIARAAKIIFMERTKGADRAFWQRFNGLWNGVQRLSATQQGLIASKPVSASSKIDPTHVSVPVEGPKDKMELVLFDQKPPEGVDIPKMTQEQLLNFQQNMFNMLSARETRLAKIIKDKVTEAVETTNRQKSAFRMNSGPTTSEEKTSDRLNEDLGGAKKSNNAAPPRVPGNKADKKPAGFGPNKGKGTPAKRGKPYYNPKMQQGLLTGGARPEPMSEDLPEGVIRTTTRSETVTERVVIPEFIRKATAAAFKAAPATNTHKDKPPALPPPRKPKPKALPAPPKPDKSVQKAFNSDNNPAINLRDKPTDAAQATEQRVVRTGSTLARGLSAKQMGINLQKTLELTQYTEDVNNYRDLILQAIQTTTPSAAEKELAAKAVNSLRDMVPVNADNENMFRALHFTKFSDVVFDQDLLAAIRRMPTFKVYSAAVDAVMPLYNKWRGKRSKPPVPLQPPAAKRKRPARTTSGSSRKTRSQTGQN